MRIFIPTIGSRGDVQTFIALAQGLSRAGHAVTLASHPVMRSLVEAHGVTFAPIGPDLDLAREVAALRHRSRNTILGLIQGMRFGFDFFGLPFIPRPRLNRQNLAAALKELSGNAGLHETASALGEKIRAEKGIEAAVSLINETFG